MDRNPRTLQEIFRTVAHLSGDHSIKSVHLQQPYCILTDLLVPEKKPVPDRVRSAPVGTVENNAGGPCEMWQFSILTTRPGQEKFRVLVHPAQDPRYDRGMFPLQAGVPAEFVVAFASCPVAAGRESPGGLSKARTATKKDYWHRGPWPQRWGSPSGELPDPQQQESPNFFGDVQASRWLGAPGRCRCLSPHAQVCRGADSFSVFRISLDAFWVSSGICSPIVRLQYYNYSYAQKDLKPYGTGTFSGPRNETPIPRPA